jgi:protein-tyrosine phosphatase
VIDTHSHLLPGLDDGADSLEESVAMAREAARQGVSEVVCTPHLTDLGDSMIDDAAAAMAELREALQAAEIDLVLHQGFEIDFYVALSATPAELAPFAVGPAGKALIIEMPYDGWLPRADEALFRLRLAGFLPVLAHPERSDRLQRRPEVLDDLLRQGAVAQGTVPSLLGDFGVASRRALLRLVSRGDLALLATDAHHSRPRAWGFEEACQEMARYAPAACTDDFLLLNPRSLLDGDPLAPAPPAKLRGGWKGFLDRFSGN